MDPSDPFQSLLEAVSCQLCYPFHTQLVCTINRTRDKATVGSHSQVILILKMHALICVLLLLVCSSLMTIGEAKRREKEVDPKECEVCISNLEMIDKLLPKEKKRNTNAIEKAITQHCTKSGAGSEWKPSENLKNPRDIKMCYYFNPIKKSIAQPFSTGMPKQKVCTRLKKDNPEICEVKYPIKVEKKEGEEVDYGKLRVKQLKTILDQRGVKCTGCTEKSDYVQKCKDTEHLEF